MAVLLELGADGWRQDGAPWEPTRPFYAVIGDPIAHSLSPEMQNAGLRAREIDAEYYALRLRAGQLRWLKSSPLSQFLCGFNVTAPHKEAVSALCDARTDQARELNAVNTVKVVDGKWHGHNTDSGGILTVVAQAWRDGERPDRVVVLGAGGSGRSAIDAVLRWGVPKLEIRNRSQKGQDAVRSWLAARETETEINITGLVASQESPATGTSLWICCLAGGVPCAEFLPSAAGEGQSLLLDLRYGDQRPLEQLPLGFEVQAGLPVLLMQGGLSFAWWQGPPVPWSEMRSALD